MKKRLFSCLLALTLMMTSGCNTDISESSEPQSKESEQIFQSQEESKQESSQIDIISSYPDKTPIYMAISQRLISTQFERNTNYINKLLVESGSEYILVPVSIPMDYKDSSNFTIKYVEDIKQRINNGSKIDLIYADHGFYGDVKSAYQIFTEDNMLEPLTGYLTGEKGQELYSSYPQKVWDAMKLNGEVYAMGFGFCFNYGFQLYMNENLLDKYNVDPSSLADKQLWEMADVFKTIADGEQNQDLVLYMGDTEYPSYEIIPVSAGVAIKRSGGKAFFMLDDEDYINRLRTLNQISQLGKFYRSNTEALSNRSSDELLAISMGTYGYDDFVSMYYKDKDGNPFPLVKIGGIKGNDIWTTSAGVGISVSSENKDGAFEILVQLNTNPDIANVIAYGIEGEDYEVVDGKANVMADLLSTFISNPLITLPQVYDNVNKADRAAEKVESAEPDLFSGFRFDATAVNGKALEIDEILVDLEKIMTVSSNGEPNDPILDFDAFIADLRTRCEAAGVYDIVDEANRQIDEWEGNGNE